VFVKADLVSVPSLLPVQQSEIRCLNIFATELLGTVSSDVT